MKDNIDLTENQMFSTTRIFDAVINIFARVKFPWDIPIQEIRSNDDLKLEHQKSRNALIVVGDKKTREKIKFYKKIDSPNYCDCCGKRMNLIPWNIEVGICRNCDNNHSEDIDKCIWRKKIR